MAINQGFLVDLQLTGINITENSEDKQERFFMSLITLSSNKSLWRGYEYYKEGRVYYKSNKSATEIEGRVTGNGKTYTVNINIEHPRKSRCNCPHADGKRVICKHMIALYFASFPKAADEYYKEVVAYEEEQERHEEELNDKIFTYLNKLSKSQLKELVCDLLYNGPEWQFERFINQNIEW